jgi:hypothetical protein
MIDEKIFIIKTEMLRFLKQPKFVLHDLCWRKAGPKHSLVVNAGFDVSAMRMLVDPADFIGLSGEERSLDNLNLVRWDPSVYPI